MIFLYVFNLTTLWADSVDQIDDVFVIIPRKQDLKLHANFSLEDNAWNAKSMFWGKEMFIQHD